MPNKPEVTRERVRKPLHARGPLAFSNRDRDPDYEYRYVSDTGSRVEVFKDAGWDTINDDLKIGDGDLDRGHKLGSPVAVLNKDGTRSLLMRIKREYYDEDQKVKQAQIKEYDAQIAANLKSAGDYGKIQISHD